MWYSKTGVWDFFVQYDWVMVECRVNIFKIIFSSVSVVIFIKKQVNSEVHNYWVALFISIKNWIYDIYFDLVS